MIKSFLRATSIAAILITSSIYIYYTSNQTHNQANLSDTSKPEPQKNKNHNRNPFGDIYSLLREYGQTSNTDNKLNLTHTLGSLASYSEDLNTAIIAKSKILSISQDDADPEIRSYATTIFARVGDPEQAVSLLEESISNGTIDNDTYHSELARIYFNPDASENIRSKIINEIANSNSAYTTEVISSIIPHTDIKNLPESEVNVLISYLKNNKPKFPRDFTSLGVSDTIFYSDWLLSTAILSTRKYDMDSISKYLLNYFENGFKDPREAVSIASHNPFNNRGNSAELTALNELIWNETRKYAESYPENQIIQMIGPIPELSKID